MELEPAANRGDLSRIVPTGGAPRAAAGAGGTPPGADRSDLSSWRVTLPQALSALVLVVCLAGLLINAIHSQLHQREMIEAVTRSDSAAANVLFTQREGFVLANRMGEWLNGNASRREIQVQRALLERRLSVVDPSGIDGAQAAGSRFTDSLAVLDEFMSAAPPGELPLADRPAQSLVVRPALERFQEAVSRLGGAYQSASDDAEADSVRSRQIDDQRQLALLLGTVVAGTVLALVVSADIRRRYAAARQRISEDRRALDQALVLDRGEAAILAGIVENRPSEELIVAALDMAHELTGRCASFQRADRRDLFGLPAKLHFTHGGGCEELGASWAQQSWTARGSHGTTLGTLTLCLSTGSESEETDATPGQSRESIANIARRCSDLVALVLDRRVAEDQLQYRASHDSLTGMLNRVSLLDAIRTALVHRSDEHDQVAVIFCDLDRFKLVNDSLGHQSGDLLLRAVALRLNSIAADSGVVVGRLGGDEFVMLCAGTDIESRAISLAEAVSAVLDGPFLIEGSEVFVAGSIGVAVSGPASIDAEDLLRNADIAMYRAKTDPTLPVVLYEAGFEEESHARLTVDRDLRRAMTHGEITVHLQPLVDLTNGRWSGFEALARWNRAGEWIPPATFLEVARLNGLLPELGRLVAVAAFDALARLRAEPGGDALNMWINLARVQLRNPSFTPWLIAQLHQREIPPGSIILELSESELLHLSEVGPALDALRSHGVRIAMDDFGTGYSSLVQLGRLPIDVVKLDRAFVADLGTDDYREFSVLAAAVKFAEAISLGIVAEGIERQLELDAVRALGCDCAQGFLFRRPAPVEEIIREFRDGLGSDTAGLTAVTAPVET